MCQKSANTVGNMNKRQQDIAFELAQEIHKNETRRDKITPYFNHVQDVARVAGDRFGFDDELIATALLHDAVESGASIVDLELAGINGRVVGAVLLLTLDKSISYEENIRAIKKSGNRLAICTKIADNLSNLADDPTDKQILKYAKSLQILMQD